jgi:arylsulfatase A-like enzyme
MIQISFFTLTLWRGKINRKARHPLREIGGGRPRRPGRPFSRLAVALCGVALLVAISGCRDGRGRPRDVRSVLLVTVETLRADRLGAYGNARPTTPRLDRFAREATVFENALAPSCFTAPSMASISTSMYPVRHGVLRWGDRGSGAEGETAAQAFGRLGYRSGFLSAHGALARIVAVTRGFDTVVDRAPVRADALTDDALRWIDREDGAFFLWVHYFDPHGPYRPAERDGRRFVPRELERVLGDVPYEAWTERVVAGKGLEFRDRVAILTGLYEGEIAGVDRAIGRLLDGLRDRGLDETTLVAVSADHGENLADHAPFFDHRNYLYESVVRVPLMIRVPWFDARRRDARPIDVLAIVPTILDLLGEEAPSSMQGRSFAARVRGDGDTSERDVYLDSGLQERPHKAIRAGRWKLTLDLVQRRYRLFDLDEDPGEVAPIEPDLRHPVSRRLRESLNRWLEEVRAARPAPEAPLSEAEAARLRELGYL